MQKKWTYRKANQEQVAELKDSLKINPILIELLVQRGITTYQDAKDFFRPQLDMLHDPFLMKGMGIAVDRIIAAIDAKEKIMIYGDYDVDGTTSVALVLQFLRQLHDDIIFYIPNRYEEGYGVSIGGINKAKEESAKLIISIDCGISANTAIAHANSLGMDFIVCDHHLPSDQLPDALAILDPKQRDCPYPFKELSGCGVGFKLCSAIATKLHMPSETYLQFIDLVAVSIASDIVPIVGENRVLAYYGLEKLNKNPILGLNILKKIGGFKEKHLTISDIVFTLGPRINAPGRMAHAGASVEILICQDEEAGLKFADNLNLHNTARRETDEQITTEAISAIGEIENLQDKRTIVLSNETWSKGVIGIVASRLVERYYKPTIIFSEKDGVLTGSARSIRGFSIYNGINACSDQVIQFGGHDFAAGLSIQKENLEAFRSKFESVAEAEITEDMFSPEIEIDRNLDFENIDFKFYNIIDQMAPFGPSNMQPVFSTKKVRDTGNTRCVGKNNTHIRFEMIDEKGVRFNGIGFGLADHIKIEDLKNNPFDIAYTIQSNEFNGKISLDMIIKDVKIRNAQGSIE